MPHSGSTAPAVHVTVFGMVCVKNAREVGLKVKLGGMQENNQIVNEKSVNAPEIVSVTLNCTRKVLGTAVK